MMEVRNAGDPATGNEIHGTPFLELVSRQALCCLPKHWLAGPPSPLGLAMEYSAASIPECVCPIRGWQEIRLSPVLGGYWVQLGAWSSFLQLLGTGSQGMLACVSLAFLGPAVLPLKSLGLTRPHSGPHCWYILSHYERNLERVDSSVGQCRTSRRLPSWLILSVPLPPSLSSPCLAPTPDHSAQSQASSSKV